MFPMPVSSDLVSFSHHRSQRQMFASLFGWYSRFALLDLICIFVLGKTVSWVCKTEYLRESQKATGFKVYQNPKYIVIMIFVIL